VQDDRRTAAKPHGMPRVESSASLPASVLQGVLTPRGLFANLFPVTFETGNLGALRQTTKAKKEDFDDRRRPRFYQSGAVLYAYGAGLDEFKDARFTAAIVAIDSEHQFAQHLLRVGLIDFFRGKGYLVRQRRVGVSVIDHLETIATAKAGFLHLFPEYTFQTFRVEGAQGSAIYAMSIEPSWATVPAFEIGPRLAQHPEYLRSLKLVLDCRECGPHCPLHERLGAVVGVFEAFAEANERLTSACACRDYTPQPVRVSQRTWVQGAKGRESSERTIVVPGQVVKPAAGQRRVLRLFSDRTELELEGRIWLGDLTRSRKARSGALNVRYERIQQFLARVIGDATRGVSFPLPTGPSMTLERLPLSVEKLSGA
jgi:hypothetical protein